MISVDELHLLAELRRCPSLAAASRALHLSPSALSHRLSALESRLGTALAVRRGRSGLVLTARGIELARRSTDLVEELTTLFEDVRAESRDYRGTLRVASPMGFGRHVLAPALAAFGDEHPGVSFELVLSDDVFSVEPAQFDLTVRIATVRHPEEESTLLAQNRRVICAAPTLVERLGRVTDPSEQIGRAHV